MKSKHYQLLLAAITAIGVLLSATFVFAKVTHHFSCFTSECWRRADIAAHPRLLPKVALQDTTGVVSQLHNNCGKPMVVNFIYTHCKTICNTLGSVSSQLAVRFAYEINQGKMKVISISFDPDHDNVAALQSYMKRLDRSHGLWQVARPTSEASNKILKDTFSVVVIDDGLGGYDHNAALYLVDKTCRIVSVKDTTDLDGVASNVQALL